MYLYLMRRMAAVFALLLCAICVNAGEEPAYPRLTGRITDYAHLLSTNEAGQLRSKIVDFERRTSAEIVVLTLDTIRPETNINTYGTALANHYGIGKKDRNNGVLLLVAAKDRQVRLEIGLGLEDAIPNSTASAIIQEQIIPLFKLGRYGEGIVAGVEAVMARLERGNQKPEKEESSNKGLLRTGDPRTARQSAGPWRKKDT